MNKQVEEVFKKLVLEGLEAMGLKKGDFAHPYWERGRLGDNVLVKPEPRDYVEVMVDEMDAQFYTAESVGAYAQRLLDRIKQEEEKTPGRKFTEFNGFQSINYVSHHPDIKVTPHIGQLYVK